MASSETSLQPLLEVRGLTAGYRSGPVVFDLDLRVGEGEAVALLGSNGAGKTTTLKAIVGLLAPSSPAVTFAGRTRPRGRPWTAAKDGIAFIPSERFTFPELTTAEHLALGGRAEDSAAARREREEWVLDLFPRLAERRAQLAGTMSGGEQRMLSLGVALMSAPRLLLLDEPSLGLAPAVVDQIMATITRLTREQRTAVLMVEQNVPQAMSVADRVYVMRSGRLILEETAERMGSRTDWWDLF